MTARQGYNHILSAEVFQISTVCPSARSAIQAKAQPSLRTGAGGVGGLVAVSVDGDFYFPGYDNNGNVIGYWDESGSIVAEYAYDAFGNTISATGTMASVFPHRFSTKYYDAETDLYYYGYRYYSPSLGRWISRDPKGEEGGDNLFSFVENATMIAIDPFGLKRWLIFYYARAGQPAFSLAATTKKNDIENLPTFDPKCDQVLLFPVWNSFSFLLQWNVANTLTSGSDPKLKVEQVHILTHSSAENLHLFHSNISTAQIKELPQLNWAPFGRLVCYGCKSGLSSENHPSVAETFADTQNVFSEGQSGKSGFSTNPYYRSLFSRVTLFSSKAYLWTFGDGTDNRTFGEARPANVFLPGILKRKFPEAFSKLEQTPTVSTMEMPQ